jgi:predicted phosphoribosyltransferase
LHAFRGDRPPPNITGRAVVLVDDGLATGVTARAALAALRRQHPSRLVFAAPVCSPDGFALVREYADTVVCVATPFRFRGVGEWYADFEQMTDEEVIQVLNEE